MNLKKFISDIFKEDKDEGKFSSKKTLGLLAGLIALISYILDGTNVYTVNIPLFNSLLLFSGSMVGASLIKEFKKKE